jgi:hypothetical protein
MKGTDRAVAALLVAVACFSARAQESVDALADRLRSTPWAAQVELRSAVDGFAVPGARTLDVSFDPQGPRVQLRMRDLTVLVSRDQLIAWNPLNASVVHTVPAAGTGVAELIASTLPPLVMPPLSVALGSDLDDPVLVGAASGFRLEWTRVAGGWSGESTDAGLRVDWTDAVAQPLPARVVVSIAGAHPIRHVLRFRDIEPSFAAPPALTARAQVRTLAELAGRVGDVAEGQLLPPVSFATIDPETADAATWSVGRVFTDTDREPAALVLLVVRHAAHASFRETAQAGIGVVTELRRELARRSVRAGRPAEAFPGVIARPVLALHTKAFDRRELAAFAEAWGPLTRQPGFDRAESASPDALWAPPAALLDRVAPDASAVILVVSAQKRLVALRSFDRAGPESRLAQDLADVIAPDLIQMDVIPEAGRP